MTTMSKRKELIELIAPGRTCAEKMVSRPPPCGYCGGIGSFTGNNPENLREQCPDCKGTGKVQAVVVLTWVPSGQTSDNSNC